MTKQFNVKLLLLLQGAVVIYSFADICAKLASRHAFLTPGYILWLGAEVLVLGVYALCWQQGRGHRVDHAVGGAAVPGAHHAPERAGHRHSVCRDLDGEPG